MPKFVFAYHGGTGMPESAEEQEQLMAAWGAWFGEMGDAVIDGGNPIGQTVTVGPGGSTTEGGGPNPLTGYSLISADDMDGALKLAGGCPALDSGGSVEVAEALDM